MKPLAFKSRKFHTTSVHNYCSKQKSSKYRAFQHKIRVSAVSSVFLISWNHFYKKIIAQNQWRKICAGFYYKSTYFEIVTYIHNLFLRYGFSRRSQLYYCFHCIQRLLQVQNFDLTFRYFIIVGFLGLWNCWMGHFCRIRWSFHDNHLFWSLFLRLTCNRSRLTDLINKWWVWLLCGFHT